METFFLTIPEVKIKPDWLSTGGYIKNVGFSISQSHNNWVGHAAVSLLISSFVHDEV